MYDLLNTALVLSFLTTKFFSSQMAHLNWPNLSSRMAHLNWSNLSYAGEAPPFIPQGSTTTASPSTAQGRFRNQSIEATQPSGRWAVPVANRCPQAVRYAFDGGVTARAASGHLCLQCAMMTRRDACASLVPKVEPDMPCQARLTFFLGPLLAQER
jgi:hypothetical protein